MPTQAYPYIAIDDGEPSIPVIADGSGGGTNYALARAGWGPQVAGRRRSVMGGAGIYDEVVEELVVHVKGATATAAMSNLRRLSETFDQAERWARGESVRSVELKYAPMGSTLASASVPYRAIILGRAEGDEAALAIPPTYNEVGKYYEIRDLRVRFLRRGLWLLSSGSVTTAAVAIANIHAPTLSGSADVPSPALLNVDGFSSSGTVSSVWLLLAQRNWTEIVEAESLATGAFTSVADGANKARNTNVLRYTPASTALTATAYASFARLVNTPRQLAIFAAVRNNSPTVSWQLKATTKVNNNIFSTPEVTIGTSSTTPQIVFLGMVSSRAGHDQIRLEVAASSTAGSPTLDIDYLVVVGMDHETSRALSLGNLALGTLGSGSITVDPAINAPGSAYPVPDVYYSGFTLLERTDYRGDAFLLAETNMDVIAVACGGQSAAHWRATDSAGNVLTNAVFLERYGAYVVAR